MNCLSKNFTEIMKTIKKLNEYLAPGVLRWLLHKLFKNIIVKYNEPKNLYRSHKRLLTVLEYKKVI